MIGNLKLRSCMINMDTEKDYGEAHLNPLQRQNMRIFRFFVKFWGAKVSMHSWRGHALNTVRVLFRCVC